MLRKTLFLLAVLNLCGVSFGKYVAVLETAADSVVKSFVSLSERQYLTNVLREKAVRELPAELNWTIMTRENILQMLPPGKALEDCEGSCLVETGKNIAADYVAQARVGMLGAMLTISAELYETAGNKLLSSFNGSSASVEGLVAEINEKAPEFFRRARSGNTWNVSGFSTFNGAGDFTVAASQMFIVDIETFPAGATLSIDGRPEPKCTSTPCRVQVEAGEHRFMVARDMYDVAELVETINTNEQKISMTMSPGFGTLVLDPKRLDNAGLASDLKIELDGQTVQSGEKILEPGVHDVQITHPCYDPVAFKVAIMKGKEERYEEPLVRAKGGLSLTAEKDGVPVVIPVYFNRVQVGSTPFVGEVPLCTKVTVGDKFNQDSIPVEIKFHETTQYHYHVRKAPGEALEPAKKLTTGKKAVGESVPTNISASKKSVRWVPLGISAAALVAGTVIAIVENSNAKSTYEKDPVTAEKYTEGLNDIRSAQTGRALGIGIAVAGALGVVLSFVF